MVLMICQRLLRSTDPWSPATADLKDPVSPQRITAPSLEDRRQTEVPRRRLAVHRPAGEDPEVAGTTDSRAELLHDARHIAPDVFHLIGRQGPLDDLAHVHILAHAAKTQE